MKKAILVGASPFHDDSFLDQDAYFVSCDGGYLPFLRREKEPDLFIGDFDTLDASELKHPKEVITLPTVKDDTDIFFSIKLLLQRGFQQFEFYGCLGNKLDHTLGNISLLSYLKDHEAKGILFDDENMILLLSQESLSFPDTCKGMISLFSFTEKCEDVTLSHLKYELDHATLSSSIPLGISNEFLSQEAKIEVGKGKLLLVTNKKNLPIQK